MIPLRTRQRVTFAPAGAVTGIGSLPITSMTEALHSVAEFSSEVPFWPQLPCLSKREEVVGQGLGILGDLIEARSEGYGYQVRLGQIDAVLNILHRSTGELPPANAAGFGAFEEALRLGLFRSAKALKGQIEGPITLSAYLFYQGRAFLSDPALFAAVAFHVSQIICWQIDRLKSAGLPVLLFCRSGDVVPRHSRTAPQCLGGHIGRCTRSRSVRRIALLCRAAIRAHVPSKAGYSFVRRP